MKPWFYAFARALLRVFFALVYPLRVTGLEHLPADGAVILCGNHLSFLDPLVVAIFSARPVRFIAKSELFAHKWLKPILDALGAFPVERGAMDMAAMRKALGVLGAGGVLGIVPQGTRDRDNSRPMETGVGLLALRSGAALVPLRIFGPYRPFRRTCVTFGAPLALAAPGVKCDSAAIRAATEAVAAAIWALPPAEPVKF